MTVFGYLRQSPTTSVKLRLFPMFSTEGFRRNQNIFGYLRKALLKITSQIVLIRDSFTAKVRVLEYTIYTGYTIYAGDVHAVRVLIAGIA